jgi:hypothetical protein
VLGGAAAAATGVGLIPGLMMMAAGLGAGAIGGHVAGESAGLGISHMFGAGKEDRKLAAGDFITKPTHALVGEAGNEYVMPEKNLQGVSAKLYNDMASHMKLGKLSNKMQDPASLFDGMASKLGSMASLIPGPIGAIAGMGSSMFGDSGAASTGDTSDLLKEQNDLLKQSMEKYDSMISKMGEASSNIERLMHVMS